MTASRRRRNRATVVGIVSAAAALIVAGVLGFAGLNTLADSTAGQAAEVPDEAPVLQRLPFTATALLGVVDDDGRLSSLAVGVLESDGTGGTLVQVPVTADPSSANADVYTPLSAVLENEGPISFREAAERLTGLSFDVIEIADQERFVEWVTPLGDLSVVLPTTVVDAASGEEWEAGELVLSAPAAARLLTAGDPAMEDWRLEPARAAVWSAVAERVGAGTGSASAVASDEDMPLPGSIDEFLDRLYAGPVSFHALQFRPIEGDELAERFDPAASGLFGDVDAVVVLDRAEMLVVFGGIAPARLGAPLDAATFRIVSGLTSDDTVSLDQTPADVLKTVVSILMFSRVNVVSVVQLDDGSAPDVTQVRVADPTFADQVAEIYGPYLGELEVSVLDAAIEGIDVEIVLGRSVLDTFADGGGEEAAAAAAEADAAQQEELGE